MFLLGPLQRIKNLMALSLSWRDCPGRLRALLFKTGSIPDRRHGIAETYPGSRGESFYASDRDAHKNFAEFKALLFTWLCTYKRCCSHNS